MYSLHGYGSMIADRVRMKAYSKALERTVREGSVVVDIGTGTGIFALLACRLGARRVYAIEQSEAIQVAKEIAAANSFDDRIEIIQKSSEQVELPEQADVIVSDIRGILPLFQNHLPVIVDARERFLKPDGVLIPGEDRLWACVVAAPEAYQHRVSVWESNEFGLDMGAIRRLIVNTVSKERFTREQMATTGKCWATLDYNNLTEADASGELSWSVEREVEAHGVALWFDTTLVKGIGFASSPGSEKTIYGNAFLPWERPVRLYPGDVIELTLRANLVGDDYVWQWHTKVRDPSDPGSVRVRFRQSTFFGQALSPTNLQKRQADYRPYLDRPGRIDLQILRLMDGERSVEQIARETSDYFRDEFPDWRAALARVGTLALRYCT